MVSFCVSVGVAGILLVMDRWGSVVVWCSSTSLVGVSVVSCQCGHGGSRVVHRWGCSSWNEEPHPPPIVGTEDAPMPMRRCRCAVADADAPSFLL